MSARRAALPVLLACAGACAGAAHAADWGLQPTFGLTGEYNTNPYLNYQSVDARTGLLLDALFPFTAKTEVTDFALNLGGRLRRYHNDPSGNGDDETLAMTIGQTHERSGWTSTAGWTRDTTLTSELGTTGITQTNQRHNRYYASITPRIQLSERSTTEFGVSGELTRYEATALSSLVDYGYASIFATYARQTSEVNSLGFGVAVSGQSVPDRPEDESVNAVGRFTFVHQSSERLQFEGYIGPAYARTRSLDRWGGVGRLSATYKGLRTDFSAYAEQSLAPAGFGNLTARRAAGLGMTNRLTEKLSAGTTVSYQRSKDALYATGTTPYDVYYWTAEEGLHWRWAETVSTSLLVSGTRQSANNRPDYADKFIAALRFNWNPRPLF